MIAPLPVGGFAEAPELGSRRTIPFDYGFRFDLRDAVAGSALQGKLTVSVEAPFVATAIGYGVVADVNPLVFGLEPMAAIQTTPPSGFFPTLQRALITLQNRLAPLSSVGDAAVASVLRNGFRINPRYLALVLKGLSEPSAASLPPAAQTELFETVGLPPERLQFLYALFDEGSGRAFQSEPILSTAGLGSPDGRRPFRHFATPITFAPRSTIRMEVTPLREFAGELHVSLHGYKVLGGSGTPTDTRRGTRRPGTR